VFYSTFSFLVILFLCLFVGGGGVGCFVAVGVCSFVGRGGEAYFGAGGNISAETRYILRNIISAKVLGLRSHAELRSAEGAEIRPGEL